MGRCGRRPPKSSASLWSFVPLCWGCLSGDLHLGVLLEIFFLVLFGLLLVSSTTSCAHSFSAVVPILRRRHLEQAGANMLRQVNRARELLDLGVFHAFTLLECEKGRSVVSVVDTQQDRGRYDRSRDIPLRVRLRRFADSFS